MRCTSLGPTRRMTPLSLAPAKLVRKPKRTGSAYSTSQLAASWATCRPSSSCPASWSAADLVYQAEHVATMLVNNAGFNCLSARVIVTHAGWPRREAFLGALSHALTQIPTRRAYYPGAEERRARFVESHPEATSLGRAASRYRSLDLDRRRRSWARR